ncbi:hypothetical protein GCM10009799_11870 [Nocardiopsis rhodophaea]|uniref:Uncharacterized protein n=2 Tax=Nocardiopsis rhodophaea TaxID=280238 RepID=A0ABN2SK53_9ACTN
MIKSRSLNFLTILLLSTAVLVQNSIPASAFTGTGGSASVAPSQPAMENLGNARETLTGAEEVKGEEAASYIDQAHDKASATGTHLRADEGGTAEFSKGRVTRLDDGTTLVVLPLTGGDLTRSALTVSFSPNGDTGVHEILLREISATSGSVEFWVNGVKSLDRVIDVPRATTKGWSEFVDCLNNSGIAAWVVAAIVAACGVVCGGTAGTACVPCIAAAAGTTGGVIGYCINEAW